MKYSAVYFNRAQSILAGKDTPVVMQVFQKGKDSVLCGVEDAVGFIHKNATGPIKVKALRDGDIVQPWEPVMTIEGDLKHFVHLESAYLGVLARMTRVATNTRRCVDAAGNKPVYFFGDRFDYYGNQPADGYAAMIGGASAVCTEAMQHWMEPESDMAIPAVGTMPHALIAAYGGDVVKACDAFRKAFPDVPLHALVDFNNDCVTDSVRCVHEFGDDLAGVRLDTSENMVDRTIAEDIVFWDGEPVGDYKPTGVNAMLVKRVREALDRADGTHVKITVSGGFSPDKIAAFETAGVPVDIYAVGSSIVSSNPIDFTADVVYPVAKAGRRQRDASRLREV